LLVRLLWLTRHLNAVKEVFIDPLSDYLLLLSGQ
jgi:hypothetical protein